MTNKGKIIVTISALVIISGGAYLLWKYFKKPVEGKSDKDVDMVPTTNIELPNTGSGNSTSNTGSVSKYGFVTGEKLYAKSDYVSVYKLPNAQKKNRVGFLKQEATSKIRFVGDSSVDGWIKVNAVHYTVDAKKEITSNGIFMQVLSITNIAP